MNTSPADPANAWIRVSCASLCRIHHPTRGYFLLLNRNRRQKGIYVLGPIGGALELYDARIVDRFGAHLENPAEMDLRLMLRQPQLPAFRDWFYAEQGREQSPFRELQEELVHEAKLLPTLTPEDMTCTRLWTLERKRLTDRKGQTGLLTHYFLEIYDIDFKHDAILGPLIAAPQAAGAMWLSEDEIMTRNRVTMQIDGAQRIVRVNARLLLEAAESPADTVVYPPKPNTGSE